MNDEYGWYSADDSQLPEEPAGTGDGQPEAGHGPHQAHDSHAHHDPGETLHHHESRDARHTEDFSTAHADGLHGDVAAACDLSDIMPQLEAYATIDDGAHTALVFEGDLTQDLAPYDPPTLIEIQDFIEYLLNLPDWEAP
jgi:hypothetical protein